MDLALKYAYCAGVIDSDGCIRVSKSTYRMRKIGDCTSANYSATVIVRQVDLEAVELLHELWPGYRAVMHPSALKGKPSNHWSIHSAAAGRMLTDILPYLRIKRPRAENALEVCRLVARKRQFDVPSINPDDALVPLTEVTKRLGCSYDVAYQAVVQKTVPFIRGPRSGRHPSVFIPESFIPIWASRGSSPSRSPEALLQLEACFQLSKRLNQVGVH